MKFFLFFLDFQFFFGFEREKSSLDRCDSFPLELDANNLISPNQQQQFNSNSIGYRLQTASPRRHRLPVQLLPNFFFTNQQRIKHQQNINKYDHFLPNLHQYSQFTSNISLNFDNKVNKFLQKKRKRKERKIFLQFQLQIRNTNNRKKNSPRLTFAFELIVEKYVD